MCGLFLCAPQVPFERVLGLEVGHFMQGLHEANGVRPAAWSRAWRPLPPPLRPMMTSARSPLFYSLYPSSVSPELVVLGGGGVWKENVSGLACYQYRVYGLGCVRSSQVVFKLQAVVSQFLGAEGQFTGVQLKDGSVVEADLCIVGAGMCMCRLV
jgi:hypothetical protein